MDPRVDRATRAARRAAAAFTNDPNVTLTIASDASNFLFRVSSAGEQAPAPFALRVSGEQSARTAAHVDCEVALLLALHAREVESEGANGDNPDGGAPLRRQLHTPVPLVARDGRRVVAVRDGRDDGALAGNVRLCVAFAWLTGGRATASEDVCMRLGAAIATLHERCAAMATGGATADGPRASDLPVLDSVFPICPPLAVRVRESSAAGGGGGETVPVATFDDSDSSTAARADGAATRGLIVTAAQAALLRRSTGCCERLLRSLYGGDLGGRPHIVHGDLTLPNVMQDNDGDGQRLHLIDFDGCAFGFAAQDLAVLLWTLQFDGLEEILTGKVSPRYAALRAAVLRGYSAVRPLPEECGRDVGGDVVRRRDETAATGAGGGGEAASSSAWPALPLLDALVAHRDLVILAWFAATDVAFLRPRVAELADATLRRIRAWVPPSGDDAPSKSAATIATIADYDAVAEAFDAGNRDHDVSQNLDALLEPLAGRERPVVVDLGCAGGRDLIALTARGCEAWGVEGAPAFCALARKAAPGCTVLEQDFVALDLPAERFDGAFANASLFHVPSEHLADVLRRIFECLKPGGVFFASNAHGFGEDKEGWTDGRTPSTKSWVCWLSEASWRRYCEDVGFVFLRSYYRGRSKAFLATVWRKPPTE